MLTHLCLAPNLKMIPLHRTTVILQAKSRGTGLTNRVISLQ